MANAADSFGPPEFFDEYRLVRRIGRGGMGQVYLAYDTVLDRMVAIKFIAAAQPDEVQRQRFLLEARAIARLQHPNVVSVHRVGVVSGHPYIVSELIEGASLEDIPKPLPWEQTLKIGVGLARALAAAHRRGILHRDVKPSNATLTPEGEVKLLDFGVAKLMDPRGSDGLQRGSSPELLSSWPNDLLTRPGQIAGTPLYAAPEVLSGEPATPSSDVYSLGALLYELCSGQPVRQRATSGDLFTGTGGTERAGTLTDGPPLHMVAPAVDPRLAAIVERCLHATPPLRFQSGDELRDALEHLQAELAPQATIPAGDPYLGLQSFQSIHRGIFYGRSRDIRAILDRLRTDTVLLIAGDSGVGKSSLCRAGVLPLVAEGRLDQTRSYQVITLVPGRRPLTSLLAALAPQVGLSEEALRILVDADPAALERSLRRLPKTGTMIFIDQTEELVTLADPQEATAVSELLGSLSATSTGVRVLMAARSDLLTRLQGLTGLGKLMSRALYLLGPLTPEEAREAIVGPARAHGVRFESLAMVETLVEASIHAPGGLSILQFALSELWRSRDVSRKLIPASALHSIGGVAGALTRHADSVLSGLLSQQRRAARTILLALVNLDGTRGLLGEHELVDNADGRAALEALVNGRLLVAREVDGGTAYELAHEALGVAWPTLRSWLDGAAERRAVHGRLRAAVAEWDRLDRSPDALFGPRQLNESLTLDPTELTPRERAFLAASRQRSRRRRLARYAAGAAAPLLGLLILTGLRVKTASDRARVLAGRVQQAWSARAGAARQVAQATALQSRAWAQFDAAAVAAQAPSEQARESGEHLYLESRELAQRAEQQYVEASEALEAALQTEAQNLAVRALLGQVTYERILLSENFYKAAQRDELRRRLAFYDPDGRLRRQMEAPAELSLHTRPTGAVASIARYSDAPEPLRLLPVYDLGSTPLAQVTLPPGSYLLRLQKAGLAPVHLPLLLGRGERLKLELELLPQASVPDGYVYVPPGRFLFGSADDEDLRRSFLGAPPLHQTTTAGYLIGRTEVTFGQWLEFLRALPPERRPDFLPNVRGAPGALELRELSDGSFALTLQPTTVVHRAREGEMISYPERTLHAVVDWRRLPVSAISFADAQAYLAWLEQSGRLPGARLCNELEWERAARGSDGRRYPHGDRLAPEDANFDESYGRNPSAFGPDEVGSHPDSQSPFGLEDMVGNVWEWTRSMRGPGEAALRGGAWYMDRLTCRSNNRDPAEPSQRSLLIGLRVCATVRPR